VGSVRASLFTYPVLMAADILLYCAEEIPVGEDQRQHVELTRSLALRFNRTYGEVFTVPRAVHPPAGARVMDLLDPARKMSKSAGDDHAGSIFLLDPPDAVRRKVMRAVTDSDTGAGAVHRDREAKPGVTNLIEILEACGGTTEGVGSYGALKAAVAEAVIAELEPVQKRYQELASDRTHVSAVYAAGAARCRAVTAPVLAAAEAAVGLV
jgi:tryptophanyl-tRNA synthetase